MNSKPMNYAEIPATDLEQRRASIMVVLADLFRHLAAPFTASDIEQAQARYRSKRERTARSRAHRSIVDSLPIEQKLRLGMYRFMD